MKNSRSQTASDQNFYPHKKYHQGLKMKNGPEKTPESIPDVRAQTAVAKMILANDVLQGLEESSMKQSDLAKKIGMSRQQLNRLLAASDNATIQTFAQIAVGLGRHFDARIARPDERVAVLSAEEMEAVHRMRARKEMHVFIEIPRSPRRLQVMPPSSKITPFQAVKSDMELSRAS